MKSLPSRDSRGPRRRPQVQLFQLTNTLSPITGDERYRARLNTVLERQAHAIGQSLHDEAGQLLAAAFLALDEASRDLPAPARERLLVVKAHLAAIEEQLRHVAHELHPRELAEDGVVSALEQLGRGFAARHGVITTVCARVPDQLPALIGTTVYRMAQEGLTNIGRHARATRASIDVAPKGLVLWCIIRVDGVGFDRSAAARDGVGLGLQGIHERVATLGGAMSIKSNRGSGTQLTAAIPLEQ